MNAMIKLMLTTPLPQISVVEAVGPMTIRVIWADGVRAGRTDIVDLSPLINTRKFFRPIRDENMFKTVHLIEDGRILAWGDDDAIDMAADSVEQLAEECMTSDDFKDYLKINDLTQNEAAALLGYNRRQIANFLSGKEPIPRVVVLATYGLAARRHGTAPNAARYQKQILVIETNNNSRPHTGTSPIPESRIQGRSSGFPSMTLEPTGTPRLPSRLSLTS